MRMWMVDPRILCRQHLLGEHGELHKHHHTFVKGWSIAGRRGQIEPRNMRRRHEALVREMLRRGYSHYSPYTQPDLSDYPTEDRNGSVDRVTALRDLLNRCVSCHERYNQMVNEEILP